MLYTSYIYLADDVSLYYLYMGVLYLLSEINHDPQASQSLTVDFFSYRLFSQFSHLAAPEAAHLELSGQN